MEIRALTGFSEETIRTYGRIYSPLNGTTVLGGVGVVAQENKVVEDKKEFKINPFALLLIGIGAYTVYKSLK